MRIADVLSSDQRVQCLLPACYVTVSSGLPRVRPGWSGWHWPAAYREAVRTPPLPVRDGLNPSRVRLPESGPWATTLEYLLQRFYGDEVRIRQKVGSGEVVDGGGTPIDSGTPFDPDSFVFLYRDPEPERRVPFDIEILYRDNDLLVIDKPHFLATMPRGFYIVESALVRLRRELELPAGQGDGRGADVFAAPRTAWRLPAAVRPPEGDEVLRGRRVVPGRRRAAHDGAEPDRQGTRYTDGRGGPGGAEQRHPHRTARRAGN